VAYISTLFQVPIAKLQTTLATLSSRPLTFPIVCQNPLIIRPNHTVNFTLERPLNGYAQNRDKNNFVSIVQPHIGIVWRVKVF
jgi:hypothetical protein